MKEADEAYDVKAGSLIFNEEYGEGIVEISEIFFEQGLIFQLDVLKDWIGCLTLDYNRILAEFEKSLVK